MSAETEDMRSVRHHQRRLFDRVAERYQASRQGYPQEVVQSVIDTASLRPGSTILEVGCGTGQLTEQLAGRGFAVKAIDLGASLIAQAQGRLGPSSVAFEVVSFEDLEAPEGAFDLIISATAFHWIDPEVKFAKSARLLKAGGWLALLATGERYDDPFGAALLDMWITRSDDQGAWARQPKLSDADLTKASSLFGSPVEWSQSEPMVLPAETVIGLETTRATFLSWPEDVQRGFIDELRRHLQFQVSVPLTQETSLTMARVLSPA